MATKEKIENEQAIATVVEADKKVAEIKAEKAAKKAKKHEERLQKHPKIGKVINWIDDNKVGVGVGVALGGPIGVGAVLGYQKIKAKKAETDVVDTETNSSESEPLPFEE